MTSRKHYILQRLSRGSRQSQVSAVLDPDSDVDSEDEGEPLWFKDFENNSLNIRPSARFSLLQNETPLLQDNSELGSTPLQKSWWKNLDDTTDVQNNQSNTTVQNDGVTGKHKLTVLEKSDQSMEVSESSLLEKTIKKQRSNLRRNKRKSTQGNIFSQILESAEDSIASEKINQDKQEQDKQDSNNSLSTSDIEKMIKKVRKRPFKKNNKKMVAQKSIDTNSKSKKSLPSVFKNVLDSQSVHSSDDSRREDIEVNDPKNSTETQEQLSRNSPANIGITATEHEHPISENVTNAPDHSDHDSEEPSSIILKSKSEKRTLFSKVRKRKSIKFDELLNDETRDELDDNQSSVREEIGLNQNKADDRSSAAASSKIGKNRSRNSPANIGITTTEHEHPISENVTNAPDHSDHDSEEPSSIILKSKSEKRTLFSKVRQRKSIKFDELLNDETRDELDDNQSSVREEIGLNQNKADDRSSAAASSKIGKNRSRNSSTNIGITTTEHEHPISENVTNAPDHSDHDSEEPSSIIFQSKSKKRTLFSKVRKRKSIKFDELLNDETQNELDNQSSARGEFGLNQNKADDRSSVAASPEIDLEDDIVLRQSESESDMSDNIKKQRIQFFNKKQKKNQLRKIFTQVLESSKSSLQLESNNADTRIPEITHPNDKSQLSNVERWSKNKKNDHSQLKSKTSIAQETSRADKSNEEKRSINERINQSRNHDSSTNELEEHQSPRIPIRRSKNARVSLARQSINKKIGHVQTPILSANEVEENQSIEEQILPSNATNRSSDSIRNKNTSMKPQKNKTRFTIQKMNISYGDRDNLNSMEESLRSSDEHVDEEEISKDQENPANTSELIDQTQRDKEYSRGSNSLSTTGVGESRRNILDNSITKSTVHDKTVSNTQRTSKEMQNFKTTFEQLQKSNRDKEKESVKSRATGNIENSEVGKPRLRTVEKIVQSNANNAERSFLFGSHSGLGLNQNNSSLRKVGLVPQTSDIEKISKIQSAREELKKKEVALMKNTKIDSYFKSTAPPKPNVADKISQKLPNKTKPRKNKIKSSPVQIDKAYLVNGKVYQRPKLPRPKPWVTDRLYKFLWNKLEPKYKLKTRIRSEKFIIKLSQTVELIVRRKKYNNYKQELDDIIQEMARLKIIETRNDFNHFCQEFLPYEFRIKVIPMILPGNVRNIPFTPSKLHTPILES